MLKAASVYTNEIDDVNLACRQLAQQLGEKLALMKNSIGIVQCSPDFIEAGIMEPLYKTLNIPLVGGTTVASAVNGSMDHLQFSILVLTSDDVDFVAAHTGDLLRSCKAKITESLDDTLSKVREQSQLPLRLALVFPPIIDAIAGDCYVQAIESVYGDTPIFGALSVDDSLSGFDRSASIYNSEAYRYEMTYVLFFGNVTPRFSLATMPRQSNLLQSDAFITRASGNIAYEINNMRAIDYFESVGIASSGKFKDGAIFIPLLMTLKDDPEEIPFVRAMFKAGEDGSVHFRGKIIEGAKFSFGSNFGTDVLSSTSDTVTGITQEKDVNAALLFSCIIRQLVIGIDFMRELALIKDNLASDIPLMASYVGGEISPAKMNKDNKACNRYHNYTFITCLL